jgi:hypothetical protein
MVPGKAFDVTQVQKAKPKTPVPLILGEAHQPISNKGIVGR